MLSTTMPTSVMPATAPAAPSNAKIPAPTIDPTPMNAAWRTFRCLTSAGGDAPSAASDTAVAPFYATTFVPASPATIAVMSSSEPMAARLPVFPAKRAAALTFGPMEPGAN